MVDGEVLTTKTANHNADAEMPEVPTKDGYTVTWKKVLDTMTGDVTVKAVCSEIPEIETSNSPQTGETTNLWLWVALLFVSGGCLFGTIEYQTQPPDKKHKLRALNLDKTGWALSFEICSLIYPFNPIVFVLLATAKARRLDVQGGGKTPYEVG